MATKGLKINDAVVDERAKNASTITGIFVSIKELEVSVKSDGSAKANVLVCICVSEAAHDAGADPILFIPNRYSLSASEVEVDAGVGLELWYDKLKLELEETYTSVVKVAKV